jgi:hypothetical protein
MSKNFKKNLRKEVKTPSCAGGILCRRVSEEGGEKDYRRYKDGGIFARKKPLAREAKGQNGVDGTNEVLHAEGFFTGGTDPWRRHSLVARGHYICLCASLVYITKVQESIAPVFGDPSATSAFLCTAS